MELLKKGPTFWLVIKIKVLKLKLKSISDAPPDAVIHQRLMYSRCYFVMKRFNSFPPTCFGAGRPSARCWFPAFKPTTGPRFVASVTAGPHFIRFHSFFCVSSFHVSKSKSCDLIFPAAIIFSPTPSSTPLHRVSTPRLCGMKALPLHHAGTSLHCTDGWLKGLLFVSWFCIWQGRRRIR